MLWGSLLLLVYSNHNQGYFEEIGINTYSNLFIDDVDSIKVWYIENEIEVVKYLTKIPKELAEALTGEDIPLYTSTDLFNYIYFNGEEYLINEYSFSKAGRTYFLELNWNGKIVTAQTTIPLPTPLDSLWVEKSENSETKASFIGSLLVGSTFVLSPVSGVLVDRFGIKKTAFIGGLIATAGVLISSFFVDNVIIIIYYHRFQILFF